jgi:hypothetical protein
MSESNEAFTKSTTLGATNESLDGLNAMQKGQLREAWEATCRCFRRMPIGDLEAPVLWLNPVGRRLGMIVDL